MNRISRELRLIARQINATEHDDFVRLTRLFDKSTKQQRYDILQIAVDKVKSRIGDADLAFQFIDGLLDANRLSDDQLYIVKRFQKIDYLATQTICKNTSERQS